MLNTLLKAANGVRRMLESIAVASGWLLLVMASVTCFDVLARKIGLPVPLTKLQELEWHFHAAIFSQIGVGCVGPLAGRARDDRGGGKWGERLPLLSDRPRSGAPCAREGPVRRRPGRR